MKKTLDFGLADIFLQKLHMDEILIETEVKEVSNCVLDFFRDEVIPRFRQVDPLFDALFREIYYSGSYYSGLKIDLPDEYDLNIVLNTRLLADMIQIHESSPGFVQLGAGPKGLKEVMTDETFCQFERLLSKSRHKNLRWLNPKAVNEWLQKVARKALPSIPKRVEMEDSTRRKIKKVDIEQNGPALTFKLALSNNHRVDLDLVPVFAFRRRRARKLSVRHNIIDPQWLRKNGHAKSYRIDVQEGLLSPFFVIPKSGPHELDWGIHFPSAEKKIIKNLACVKPVIRYLKHFRDNHEILSNVKSYALLTIVMKMIRNHNPTFWNQNTSKCLLAALRELACAMENGVLGWFFQENCNILPAKYYSLERRRKIVTFLKTAILDLESDHTLWHRYF